MSICVNITGIIKFKEAPQSFPTEELKKYDDSVNILESRIFFQVKDGYMHYPVIDYIKEYLKNNINIIEGAFFRFINDFDDDIPYIVQYEVWDNKFYENFLSKNIPIDWLVHNQDFELLPQIHDAKCL